MDKTYTYYNPMNVQNLKRISLETFGNSQIPSNFFEFWGCLYNRTKISKVESKKSPTSLSYYNVYIYFTDNSEPVLLVKDYPLNRANEVAKLFAKNIYAVE